MDWVLHDVPKRKKNVVEVLEPVRFPLLSPQRLFKYIEGKRKKNIYIYIQICTFIFDNSNFNILKINKNNVRLFSSHKGITDFSLRVALQTLLKEYTEVTKCPKENKVFSQLQPAKMRPRRKARKYLYAIGVLFIFCFNKFNSFFLIKKVDNYLPFDFF